MFEAKPNFESWIIASGSVFQCGFFIDVYFPSFDMVPTCNDDGLSCRRIKLGVSLLKETCARWGNLLTTFHWIHDGMFSSSLSSFGSCGVRAAPGQLISPSRADVLEDMKKVSIAPSSS